ncbi:pentraxin fusion protein-like [Mercenaria mercenaria]|uniref:pentraxin fusion protein-like n=1 Tax=Mercenaria mercenaria TaxID=6596 RepID=UPI00234F022D|nr:pentraxin fusion protein-like [Mercenaria mercenaria]
MSYLYMMSKAFEVGENGIIKKAFSSSPPNGDILSDYFRQIASNNRQRQPAFNVQFCNYLVYFFTFNPNGTPYGSATSQIKDTENLALGKKAYQSSDLHKGFADKAVDGGLSQTFSDGSCTHTNDDANSYWEVDLGKHFFIDHVTIYNRRDVPDPNRLRHVELYIGCGTSNYKRYGYYGGVVGSRHTFNLTQPAVGQWVRITRIPSVADFLSLCEVQVFGWNAADSYFRINEDKKGAGISIQASLRTTTIQHCGYTCYKTCGCEAANYDDGTHMCDLLTSNSAEEADGQSLLIPL